MAILNWRLHRHDSPTNRYTHASRWIRQAMRHNDFNFMLEVSEQKYIGKIGCVCGFEWKIRNYWLLYETRLLIEIDTQLSSYLCNGTRIDRRRIIWRCVSCNCFNSLYISPINLRSCVVNSIFDGWSCWYSVASISDCNRLKSTFVEPVRYHHIESITHTAYENDDDE